jgi:hypothetical protein
MDVYRPLRAVLFFYELARLVLVVGAAAGFMAAEGNEPDKFFPYLVYAVPNALFPLMALFLWFRLEAYQPYLPLYMAGKTIVVVSAVVWLVFSFRVIPELLYSGGIQTLMSLGTVCLLVFTDLFSILGTWFLRSRLKGTEIPAPEQGGTECV